MASITESSITLNFPDEKWFRFNPGCKGYARLSAHGFKEMDACWFDSQNNTCWIFELKDFTADLNLEITMKNRAWNLVKKAVDTLCMFVSSKHQYLFAINELNPCFSFAPTTDTVFKFVSIVHCAHAQKTQVTHLNDLFKDNFKPYAKLFNITHFSV